MTRQRMTWRAHWPLYLGMTVAGAAAVVGSATTLAALAQSSGWAGWTPWLLPAALDVSGAVGAWAWLRPGAPARAVRYGRAITMICAMGTLVGNAVGHLVSTGHLVPGPVLIVAVGAVPAAVLVMLVHLGALLVADPAPETAEAVVEESGRVVADGEWVPPLPEPDLFTPQPLPRRPIPAPVDVDEAAIPYIQARRVPTWSELKGSGIGSTRAGVIRRQVADAIDDSDDEGSRLALVGR